MTGPGEYRPGQWRVGGHWSARGGMTTVVLVGAGPPDARGRRPDDELLGMMRTPELAATVVAAVNRGPATGVAPCDGDWDLARRAHDAAVLALLAVPEAAVPQPVRDAVDALGGLLSVWDGYGEESDGG